MAERRFKVVLLGEGRVGKTSILVRYVSNRFDDKQASTLSAAFLEKSVPIGGGETVRACIWDTAGQERFHALGPLYYRDADGALLVYDITDEASFNRVKDWVKELRKMLGDEIVLAIAGNKADMEKNRIVPRETALQYASQVGASHHLTSAKAGTGVDETFSELMRRIVNKKKAAAAGGRIQGGPITTAGRGGSRSQRIQVVDDDLPPMRGSGGKEGSCC